MLLVLGPAEQFTPKVQSNAVASARGTIVDVSYHEGQPPPATP
jgi:hypothetical protein